MFEGAGKIVVQGKSGEGEDIHEEEQEREGGDVREMGDVEFRGEARSGFEEEIKEDERGE